MYGLVLWKGHLEGEICEGMPNVDVSGSRVEAKGEDHPLHIGSLYA